MSPPNRLWRLAVGALLVPVILVLAGCGSPPSPPVQTVLPSRADEAPAGDASGSDREILKAHNRYRAAHCAEPLRWSRELAKVAQRWADRLREDGCAFEHSPSSEYGENLFFAAPSSPSTGAQAVDRWYAESERYDFVSPGFSMQTGHFTQVVWRGSRLVGCGSAQCNGGDIVVCNYAPAGNVEDLFAENVLPTSCR